MSKLILPPGYQSPENKILPKEHEQQVWYQTWYNDKLKMNVIHPCYPGMVKPFGMLDPNPSCQALMHYALIARMNYEHQTDTITGEDEHDRPFNYNQLFKSIAGLHNVEPDSMLPFWTNVDGQFILLHLPLVPQHLRFDWTVSISLVKKGN